MYIGVAVGLAMSSERWGSIFVNTSLWGFGDIYVLVDLSSCNDDNNELDSVRLEVVGVEGQFWFELVRCLTILRSI